MTTKRGINWDEVEGIDDKRVTLRAIAARIGCSHVAVGQAREKRSRETLRRVLKNMIDVADNGHVDNVAQVLIDEAKAVLRG
jgi:hypothetical protein